MTRTPGRTQATTATAKPTEKRAPEPRSRPRTAGATPGQQRQPAVHGAVRADQPRYSTVNLRVHEIRCITTTGELGADNIVLAAVKVEGAVGGTPDRRKLVARAQRGEQLDAGKFTKGDRQTYPKTRVLATYDAGGPIGADPRYFLGALVFVEADRGRVGEVIAAAVESVEKQVVAAVSTVAVTAAGAALSGMAAGATIGSVVPLFGTAIGTAAGAAIGLAIGEVTRARADEVFPLERVELELSRFPSEPGEIPGSRRNVTFKGFKGHYVVETSWAAR